MADQHVADQAMGEQVTKIGEDGGVPLSVIVWRSIRPHFRTVYVVHANVGCRRAVFGSGVRLWFVFLLAYLGYFNR